MEIFSRNVQVFSFIPGNFRRFSVDKFELSVDVTQPEVWLRRDCKSWTVITRIPVIRSSGPLSSILRSARPILVVVPIGDSHSLTIATRIVHSLLLYFRVDASIISDVEALETRGDHIVNEDTIVIGSKNAFGLWLLQAGSGTVRISTNGFTVNGIPFEEPALGIVFAQPHSSRPQNTVVFLCGTDDNGLERVSRLLLPIRSGVPLPEFLILGKETDIISLGGVRGAGFWDRTGVWSNEMAWINDAL